MKYPLKAALERLQNDLRNNKLIVFVGSGISVNKPSNLPTWDGFISDFVKFCVKIKNIIPDENQQKEFDVLINNAKSNSAKYPTRVASVLKAELIKLNDNKALNINVEAKFKEWFVNMFSTQSFNKSHEAIVNTNYRYILTSNYDLLLEKAAESQGYNDISLRSFTFTEADNIASSIYQNQSCIIHMHGKFTDAALDKVVFTSEDYRNMLNRKYPGFTMSIQSLFLQYSTLFVGYGGSDPHLEDLIEETSFFLNYSDLSGLPRNYMVVTQDKADHILEKYKENLRTDLIVIDDMSDYSKLLTSLQNVKPRSFIH